MSFAAACAADAADLIICSCYSKAMDIFYHFFFSLAISPSATCKEVGLAITEAVKVLPAIAAGKLFSSCNKTTERRARNAGL